MFFLTKTVKIRWNWRCKIFSLKIRRCKILVKFHVCVTGDQLIILSSKICSGTLEASLSRSLWRSSLGRNSLLSQTGLKSKQTPYLDELSFFLHIFNCLILKNILTTVFQIYWTEGSAHRQDGRNGGPRKVFHPHPHRSSLFLHSYWLVITIQLYLWSIITRASDVRLEKYYPGEKFALHPQ